MASSRHKHARARALTPRLARLAMPALAATLVTGSIVGSAITGPDPQSSAGATTAVSGPVAAVSDTPAPGNRVEAVSRSAPRVKLTSRPDTKPVATKPATKTDTMPKQKRRPKPEPAPKRVAASEIVDRLFLSTALNVWSGPGEKHTLLDVLPAWSKVPVTGEEKGPWAEISYEGRSRWVNAAYLVEKKPQPQPKPEMRVANGANEISRQPCRSGSTVENGLTSDAVLVHRAVCARFPQIKSYGGLRSDGEHGQGRAVDIMVSGSLGDQVAGWLRERRRALGISELIWSQRIWTVQRNSEGWRGMESRGSTTANHYDHVHVTVHGSAAR